MKLKLFFTLLLLLAATTANAARIKVDGIYYNTKGRTASVTSNPSKYSGEIIIPETFIYNGATYTVTAIGEYAFNECSGVTKVSIPNTVTSIGDVAFANCSGLTSINIPNALASIGHYGLGGCSALTSLTIPNTLTSIGSEAFEGCWSLVSLIVESGNPSYDSRDNCNAIIETASNTLIFGTKKTIIPNSVTAIGDHAFSNCRGLTSVTIPNTVTSIGEMAFFYCRLLTSVTIPKSVTFIGRNPFIACEALTSLTVERGNPSYDSRENCNAIIDKASKTLISACKNTIIPNSVTTIGKWAFGRLSGLGNVVIPSSVTSIGDHAFYMCSGRFNVTIPNSVNYIGDYAFAYCFNLAHVYSYIKDLTKMSYQGDMLWESSGYSNFTLHVPYGTANDYRTDNHWDPYFVNIVEMDPIEDMLGDVNCDGVVDLRDVTFLLNLIWGGLATVDNYPNADLNADGLVNITDVADLIDLILTSNQ